MIGQLPPYLSAALRMLPLFPLQLPLTRLFEYVVWRYPLLFDRLGEHAGKRFGVEPTDLPFALLFEACHASPRVTILRRLPATRLDAHIAGPLAALIGLVNGSHDGDALFFSRDIRVEGDISAIVALRNAIEGAGIDLVRDGAACLGPFGFSFEWAAGLAATLADRLTAGGGR